LQAYGRQVIQAQEQTDGGTMTEYWWRSWHGAPMDHKWPVVAARAGVKVGIVSAVAWALIDYASQQPNRGDVTGFDVETYAVYSGFAENEITAVLMAMEAKGVIIDGRLANWEKRQPKREDDSSPRVRKFREKERSVTQCNATEEDTEEDTDTEEDKDKKREEEPSASAFSDSSPEIVFYHEISGHTPDYMTRDKVITNIKTARKRMKNPPIDVFTAKAIEAFTDWCNTERNDGTHRKYSATNPGWTDWLAVGQWSKPIEEQPLTLADAFILAGKNHGK
jgi:hypothetical protein